MNNRSALRIFSILLVFVVLFGIVQTASADLKATAVFSILSDETPPQYKNSLVKLELDGEPTHVLHELGTDADDYFYTGNIADSVQPYVDLFEACEFVKNNATAKKYANCPVDLDDTVTYPGGEQYQTFAGVLELGIPREDGGGGVGTGAFAFENSASWTLVDCDLDGDDDFDGDDLDIDTRILANYPATLAPWDATLAPNNGVSGWNFKVLAEDDVRECSNNTCFTELVTTIFLDLDVNDDGVLNQCTGSQEPGDGGCELPVSGSICFFAEVYPITYSGGPTWAGNAQARFSAGGGDKTVNLNVLGPTAITLEQLIAQSPGGLNPVVLAAIFILLTAIAFVLVRESRQQVFIRKDE